MSSLGKTNYIMSSLKNHNDIGILILDLTLQYKFEMKGHWLNTIRFLS